MVGGLDRLREELNRMTRPRVARRCTLLLLAASIGAGACERGESSPANRTPALVGVIDSALPIDTLLRRFRAAITDTPTVLLGGAATPEALTQALLTAVGRRDTSAIRSLVMNRSEFAWLYYPHTKFTRQPYELGPDLVWMQTRLASEQGITRLFARYGGSQLRFAGLSCSDSSTREGPNRLVADCRVRFAAADSAERELRLFGALLNRDGRYKFLTYANDL